MDFDDLLPHVGEFGRYQKLLVFLICLPACIPCGFHAFNQLFMSPTPPHWCSVPELEGTDLNWEWDAVKNLSIPRLVNILYSFILFISAKRLASDILIPTNCNILE